MSSEYNSSKKPPESNQIDCPSDQAWADLTLTVPNEESPLSIVSFVESVLVELTHEPVAAEYVSSHIWGEKRTRYFAVDGSGEHFEKRYSDDLLGSHTTLLNRRRVRTELMNRLSRNTVTTTGRLNERVEESDTFRVRPLRELDL
ncbi:hypothetical protein EGH24_12445 [Halonotius terrestris]|uniref:DUF8030 domain-containing protein n=1 Tax=Halonotius terrestris TaxID=2487750 RepID=A0A8J8P7D1_9EURY|nr:hypothetical protein EGH24_12445 [Halonotius terrestris]